MVIFRWPWRKHRAMWESLLKRQRRQFSRETMLRGIDQMAAMTGALPAVGVGPAAERPDEWAPTVNDRKMPTLSRAKNTDDGALRQSEVDRLRLGGWPVKVVYTDDQPSN